MEKFRSPFQVGLGIPGHDQYLTGRTFRRFVMVRMVQSNRQRIAMNSTKIIRKVSVAEVKVGSRNKVSNLTKTGPKTMETPSAIMGPSDHDSTLQRTEATSVERSHTPVMHSKPHAHPAGEVLLVAGDSNREEVEYGS
ncbi:MAG: hypothetical protein ACTSSE_17870 [Candidatus Thorarchaeota archaeon]